MTGLKWDWLCDPATMDTADAWLPMPFEFGLQLLSPHTRTLNYLPHLCRRALSPSSCAHSIVLLIHSLMLQILSGQRRLSTMLGTGDEMVIALSFFELFLFKVCPILGECSYVMLWGAWAQGGPAMPGKGTCWMFQILSQSQWYVCLSL